MTAAERISERTPSGWVSILIALLFFVALGLIIPGQILPAISISTFFFSRETISVITGIQAFYEDGQYALGTLILLVSIILPLAKIIISLLILINFNPYNKVTSALLSILATLSVWSMTDVFIFAMIVLIIDGRLLTTADLDIGAYLFAGGVLLSTLLSGVLRWRAQRLREAID